MNSLTFFKMNFFKFRFCFCDLFKLLTLYLFLILFCSIISSSLSKSLTLSSSSSSLSEDYAIAFDHGARVRLEGACHQPRPMIIYVNKTDPSKVHLPRGTVLHRCSDLTGCCQSPSEVCTPIEMQTVELYFMTLTLQVKSERRGVRHTPNVEKILFTNHTLCGCRPIKSLEYKINEDPRENELK